MAVPNHSTALSFKKLDLHLHTPASACFRDRAVTPSQIADAALAAGLDGIAVTDHNSGVWVDDLRQAAAGKPLTIFPGVEITCQGGKGGLQAIALLDPSAGKAEIESLSTALDLEPKDYGRGVSSTTPGADQARNDTPRPWPYRLSPTSPGSS